MDNEQVNPSVTPKGTANQCVVTKGRERWNFDKNDKIEDNCSRPTSDCAPALILGDKMNIGETQAPSTHFTKPAGGGQSCAVSSHCGASSEPLSFAFWRAEKNQKSIGIILWDRFGGKKAQGIGLRGGNFGH